MFGRTRYAAQLSLALADHSTLLQFLFLSEDEAAPLKGVDFGLAVFFDPQQLPVTGLNPEGTPW